jgi:hypothetical protein
MGADLINFPFNFSLQVATIEQYRSSEGVAMVYIRAAECRVQWREGACYRAYTTGP